MRTFIDRVIDTPTADHPTLASTEDDLARSANQERHISTMANALARSFDAAARARPLINPTSSLGYLLSGHHHRCSPGPVPPSDEDLRLEDPARPNVADLLPPGTLFHTSYSDDIYMVGHLTPVIYYGRYRAFSITGYRSDDAGNYVKNPNRVGTFNEIVIDWSNGEPCITKLFRANKDEIHVVGKSLAVDRRGQGLLF
ncbi:hypothetical protein [Sphingomonas sp. 3-13AW]|uniref:hypothetical protein n=1 Tax=Sphingomonas sp. 3-13AW TaxID=3050450 RepID=UPI003BB78337